ncbi:hypothetical protein JCM10212_002318 [Sporobolomyces blumeae]
MSHLLSSISSHLHLHRHDRPHTSDEPQARHDDDESDQARRLVEHDEIKWYHHSSEGHETEPKVERPSVHETGGGAVVEGDSTTRPLETGSRNPTTNTMRETTSPRAAEASKHDSNEVKTASSSSLPPSHDPSDSTTTTTTTTASRPALVEPVASVQTGQGGAGRGGRLYEVKGGTPEAYEQVEDESVAEFA